MAYYGAETGYPSQARPVSEGLRPPHSPGIIIAIGGNAGPEIISSVVNLAGKDGKLFVSTLASKEPEASFEHNNDPIHQLGEEATHLGTKQDLLRVLDKNRPGFVVLLGGGNQEAFMEKTGRYVQDQLRQTHQRGLHIAGTSAGAAVMGEVMIVGDKETEGITWHLTDGLKLIPRTIIDTHFSERQRVGRLRQAVRQRGMLGIGLDEGTGFITHDGQEIEVIGKNGVHIVHSGGEMDLTAGERFHLGTRQVLSRQH